MTTQDTLWYTRCPVPSPLGIAARLGWLDDTFGPLGLTVKSIIDSPDPRIRDSHFNHHLPWSFRQGGNIPALWARANFAAGRGAQSTRLVAITWTDEFQALITLPGRGIRTVADLAGRRVAVPRNDGAVVDFQRATSLKGIVSGLSLAGLTARDVTLVDLPAPDDAAAPEFFGLKRRLPYAREAAALWAGDVDAFFVKGAEGVVVANLLQAHLVAEFGRHPDPKVRINNGTPRTLTVDETLATDRPDLVQALLSQVERATAWAEAHPDETLRIVAREIHVSEDAVLASNGPDVHRHLALSLDPALVDALAHFKSFLREWGFLPADFDVNDWVDPAPLQAVRALPLAA